MTPSFPATGYRIRTRPLCAPGAIGMNDNLRFHQSAAALPSPGSGTLAARTFERSGPNTVGARALAASLSFGKGLRRLIRQILRAIQAPGSPVLRTLVQDPQKSASSILSCFKLSPVLSSSVVHKGQSDRRNGQGVVT